jgi:hypothetical protein
MSLTRIEAVLLVSFLEDLDDNYGNAGSNDLFLPDTLEMREVVLAAEKDQSGEPNEKIRLYNGKIYTSDQMILGYLRDKIMKEHNVSRKELVR